MYLSFRFSNMLLLKQELTIQVTNINGIQINLRKCTKNEFTPIIIFINTKKQCKTYEVGEIIAVKWSYFNIVFIILSIKYMTIFTLFSSEPRTEKLINPPPFPEVLWVILLESQKFQKLMRNYDHPFPIFHIACRFIQENVLGVLELGREGGEAEIGSGVRVGGRGQGSCTRKHHTSLSFFLSKVVPAF